MERNELEQIIKNQNPNLGETIYKNAVKNNNSKKKKHKKQLRKKIISTSLIAVMSFSLGMVSVHANQLNQGAKRLGSEFSEYTDGYKINTNPGGGAYITNPDGLSIITFATGEQVSLEPAYEYMIEDYKESGATMAETYVAVRKVLGKDAAAKYVGELPNEEIDDAKMKAYHEQKLEELNLGGRSK